MSASGAEEATEMPFTFDDVSGEEISLHDVQVMTRGPMRTDNAFLASFFQPLAKASTLEDATREAIKLKQELDSLGIFKHVGVGLMPHGDQPGQCDAVLDVIEKGPWSFSTEAFVQGAEPNLGGELCVNNVFGRAEKLTVGGSMGTQHSGHFHADLSKPHVSLGALGKAQLLVSAFRHAVNYADSSSCEEHQTGVTSSLSLNQGKHTLAYNGVVRQVLPRQRADKSCVTIDGQSYPGVSQSMLQEAQTPSLKSSLSYTVCSDSRNQAQAPTRGSLLSATAELAGLGGDAKFVKVQAQAQHFLPVNFTGTEEQETGEGDVKVEREDDVSIGFSAQAGLLRPLASLFPGKFTDAQPTRFSDKFFTGGPNVVRGTASRMVGARDQHDATGGDVFFNATALLSLRSPVAMLSPTVRPHVFVNAGNTANLGTSGWQSEMRGLVDEAAVSVGGGVGIASPIGRFELNFCHPVRAAGTAFNKFQFGLSWTYQ